MKIRNWHSVFAEKKLHSTGMLDDFEFTAPTLTTTGCTPVGALAGTRTLIWYSPTYPGARPANRTSAGWPPICTVGLVLTGERVVVDAGSPLAGWLFTGPSPFVYRLITLPRLAL